ncbi:Pycsar system effector family protein [Phytomonospora sp. NPDC050363]|uniref:Pycsar system effector family protein n=1 Tax=Phytomonospora sp. NPDC050363 TaxID=3155642 RepID=UPI00340E5B80
MAAKGQQSTPVPGVVGATGRKPAVREPPDVEPADADPTVVENASVQLNSAITMVRMELARADLKAQALLAGASAALIIGISALGGAPRVAQIVGGTAVAIAFVAVILLALAIRPFLKGRFGLMKYARMSPEELAHHALRAGGGAPEGIEALATELAGVASLAESKYRVIRRALNLLLGAGLLGLAAAALTLPSR